MPTVVAPAAAIAERRLIERLLRARAFTAATGAPLTDLSGLEQRLLEHLQEADVVVHTGNGTYFLDGPALADRWYRGSQRQRILVAVVAAVLAVLVGVFAYLQG